MRKAKHLDISSRLEATKRLGLVADYRIEWPQKSENKPLRAPHVTVMARPAFPAQVTKNYVTILLAHLVPTRAIVVTRDY